MKQRHRWVIGVLAAVALAVLVLIAPGEEGAIAQGGILYVDADATGAGDGSSWADAFVDLQDALEMAGLGDQIRVAAGTYKPTHEFTAGDPRSATFQMKNGVAIYGGFAGGEKELEQRDWLANLTILSGDIGIEGDSSDNVYHVFYHPYGTGLDSSAILDGFTITGGHAHGEFPNIFGGGMHNRGSSPTVNNCTFRGNSADNFGGGMYNLDSSPVLTNCIFEDNSAYEGGGMFNGYYSSPALTECIFADNSANNGGGMYNNQGSSPTLTNCTFSGNSEGGMRNTNSNPVLVNCIFSNNSAYSGGGMHNDDSFPTLTNCTFSGNSAYSGGGMYNSDSTPTLINSILWGDSPTEIANSDLFLSPLVTYSDVQGGHPGDGNIDAHPFFVDATNENYHLLPNSPCIDAGNNLAPDLPEYDFEGDPRVLDGDGDGSAIVDMGVDEVYYEPPPPPPDVIFVDAGSEGANTGLSWDDAFTTLQPALAWAVEGVEIWVAEGTYKPAWLFSPGDPRSATFQMKNGVAIYGGFAGGETELEQRDWLANLTILSGDIGIEGDNSDNSYHVFYHPASTGLGSTAVLDGFTITAGNADEYPNNYGGGMYNSYSSPVLTNCTFEGNSAGANGGGMSNSNSSPVLTNCTFSENSADDGGGMYSINSSSPALIDCVFSDNSARYYGGGMSNYFSSPTLTNCIFSGNSVVYEGGGMHNTYSTPTLTNCTFSGNSAVYDGGGIYNAWSSPSLTNCILWGDTYPEIENSLDSTPVVTYSDIQGSYPGEGNINADPLFVDAASGDYHLGPRSPCIDVGDNDTPELPEYDFEGDDRVLDGDGDGTAIVDMGVDESDAEPPPPPPDVIFVDVDAEGANDGTSWADAFTTLQPALAWAVDGVEIWVAAGTYKPTWEFSPGDPRSVTFQMKNGVGVYGGFAGTESELGQRDWLVNLTILSGDIGIEGDVSDNSYHVFYHPDGTNLNNTAILDGFTITAGNADGDYPHNGGGGMYNRLSSPTLTNVTFSGNSASNGGGMRNYYRSSPTLTNCTFSDNSAGSGGGMANIEESSPTLANCTFSGNSAGMQGGGMFNNYFSSPILADCIFLGNTAGGKGGGIYSDSFLTLTNCTFLGNTAGDRGGGMYNHGASPRLTNCIFERNSAYQGGGMFNGGGSSPVLTNCTLSGNSAGLEGGAMISDDYSSPTLTNCILWDNTPDQICNGSSPAVVTFSDVEGTLYPGTGNINVAPLFADAANGDFHLEPNSPCIDAGSNAAPYLPLYDFEGDERVLDGDGDGSAIVDMGVDEVYYEPPPPPPDVIFVDAGAEGANTGLSWDDAFTTLQPALAWAVDGVEIWVAVGTYKPTWLFSPGDPRSATFQMKNGVGVYGGFAGTESELGQRDWLANLTILSGDIGTEGDSSDNVYHVFYHPDGTGLDSTAILDGFTITGGNANGDLPHTYGGGMLNYGSSPMLANCTFEANTAIWDGGGIYNRDGSSPTLSDCNFNGNAANWGGGGIYNVNNSHPTLTNCTFWDNSAGMQGGGIFNVASSSPVLVNCTFWANSADFAGAIYNINGASPVLTNCTLTGNSASSAAGGIYNYQYSNPVLTNCILWGDTNTEIESAYGSEPVVTYSDVQGGYIGQGNIDVDPSLVDSINGNLHLLPNSPCIDAGDNDAPNLPLFDFEGDGRILDGNGDGSAIVDMGADEVVYTGPFVVEIDIRPGSDQNVINLGSGGLVPVAILTTAKFDAATVKPASVRFAGAAPRRWTMEDVDSDGDLDLLLNFRIRELELDETSTEATLTGVTFPHAGGLPIEGTDMVRIIP